MGHKLRVVIGLFLSAALAVSGSASAIATNERELSKAPAFDTNQAPAGSYAATLIATNSGAYFQATTLAEGKGIWFWEPGLSQPVFQSEFPNSKSYGYAISNSVEIAGVHYFQARTSDAEMSQFYSFDPAAPQGSRVTKLTDYEYTEWNHPSNLTAFNGRIIYLSFQDSVGYEFFEFDPITKQRSLFLDRIAGTTYPSSSYGPRELNGKLYASWGTSYQVNELYEISAGGQATEITTGPETQVSWIHTYPSQDLVMFVASDSTNGEEVWFYDTVNQTHGLFYDMYAGANDGDPYLYGEAGGKFFFGGTSASGKRDDVFIYDPAGGGSVTRITDFASSWVFGGLPVGNAFYFVTTPGGSSSDQLYRVDPANPTPQLLGDVESSNIYQLGTSVMVSRVDGNRKSNPWYYNAVSDQLEQIFDFTVPTDDQDVDTVVETENYLVIGGEWDGVLNEDAVYYFDLDDLGTNASPVRILNDSDSDLFGLDKIFEIDGHIVTVHDLDYPFGNTKLRVFDPSNPQAGAIDLATRESYSTFKIEALQIEGGTVYLYGEIESKTGLFSWTDPLAAPALVKEHDFGDTAFLIGSHVFYMKWDSTNGNEPWRYNLLTDQEELFLDITAGSGSTSLISPALIDGKLYVTHQGANGYEPHLLDFSKQPGDPTSFFEIADLDISGNSWPRKFTKVGDKVAFEANSRTWVYDPATNAVAIVDGTGTSATTYPDSLAELDGKLMILGNEPGSSSGALMYVDISQQPPADGYTPRVALTEDEMYVLDAMFGGADRVYYLGMHYPWGTELMSLTLGPEIVSSSPVSQYTGPLVQSVPTEITRGERFEVLGQRLEQINGISFGDESYGDSDIKPERTAGGVSFIAPVSLALGEVQLTFTGSFGALTFQQDVSILPQPEVQVVVKPMSDDEHYKVYVFFSEEVGKVKLLLSGREHSWFDPSRTTDRLRSVELSGVDHNYFVRTLTQSQLSELAIDHSSIRLHADDWRWAEPAASVTALVTPFSQ